MKIHILMPIISIISFQLISSEEDGTSFAEFCYPVSAQTQKKSCACIEVSSPPWGLQSLRIDCSFRNLETSDFRTDLLLPLKSEILDFSWNKLETIPSFVSDSLKHFNLMHNNVSKILDKNFVKLKNLKELYLRWNGIQTISRNAFAGIEHLTILDLSHNNLKELSEGAFLELPSLETLSLSWNRGLSQTMEKTSTVDIYSKYGINLQLKVLNLEKCGLQKLNFVKTDEVGLIRLNLRNNHFKSVPIISANNLKELDFSENPIRSLSQNEVEHLPKTLTELLIEDMPEMETIEAEAFVPMIMLKKLSAQNSRKLIHFNEYAFGSTSKITLQSLNLRGTGLHKLNSTLLGIFTQLDRLDLTGCPLNCDCDLLWMKELTTLDSNAKCFKPSRLRGMSVKNVPHSEFVCDKSWPHWAYNGIIFLFIISFVVLIVTVGVMLRPQRGKSMTPRRVGAGSPYARITIEPNRSENNF